MLVPEQDRLLKAVAVLAYLDSMEIGETPVSFAFALSSRPILCAAPIFRGNKPIAIVVVELCAVGAVEAIDVEGPDSAVEVDAAGAALEATET